MESINIKERIDIGGRDVPLWYDMAAMERGVDVFGSVDELHAAMEHQEGRNAISDMIRMIVTLGNNGLEMENKKPDLDEKIVKHHLKMMRMGEYASAVNKALAEGYRREISDAQQDGPRDAYLEEDEGKNA